MKNTFNWVVSVAQVCGACCNISGTCQKNISLLKLILSRDEQSPTFFISSSRFSSSWPSVRRRRSSPSSLSTDSRYWFHWARSCSRRWRYWTSYSHTVSMGTHVEKCIQQRHERVLFIHHTQFILGDRVIIVIFCVVTFHDGLQRGHLLLPLTAHLVDGFLLGVFRHSGDRFDGLDLGAGLSQLLLDRTELLLSTLQRHRLALQLL